MKFFVHKLGCPKNDVDADYIAARLIAAGHEPVSDPERAESVIVNTCGFILPAKEESINEILRLGQLKKSGNLKTLYATGCLTQRYGDQMIADMPELDGAFGHGALDSLAEAVSDSRHLDKTIKMEARKLGYLSWKDRFISDGYPYSYVKISDGCDRMCTYCAIPSMRGKFRSRPIDSIVREAQFLANNGKKELILVSQEATLYGYDLPGRPSILDLLKALEKVEGVEWIRLMYLYPAQMSAELIDYMVADNTKTLNYFDLPLQHINTEVLSNMRRQVTRDEIERMLTTIRAKSPEATIRTTFIVGFPGETDEQFGELLEFTTDFRFDRMGVFTYSAEEGTPAEQMGAQLPEEVKKEREEVLMTAQREIALAKNNSLIGSQKEVIIDSVNDDNSATGRTRADCPEIDQEVMVTGAGLAVGQIVQVKIDAAEGYDLIGSLLRD